MLIMNRYRRDRALTYARRWALDRNPLFTDFSGIGGNCTNFASQCVLAGSCVMNYTPDFGWYYVSPEERAPAWSGVDYFYDFLTGAPTFEARNGGIGPYAVEVPREAVEIGDVIQIAAEGDEWSHTMVVSAVREDGEILVCAHSVDSLDRPLSTYEYENVRYLHILGVRVENDDTVCYEYLLRGGGDDVIADDSDMIIEE
ncbi:MAG: amidase domain-containing protein [Clostridia bacterium]|nr:amidase domain-containing protein [Clostridia bacterium]